MNVYINIKIIAGKYNNKSTSSIYDNSVESRFQILHTLFKCLTLVTNLSLFFRIFIKRDILITNEE